MILHLCHFLTSDKVSSSQEEGKGSLLHPNLNIIRKRDHANRLPDAEGNTRCNTAVESPDAVLLVDEGESIEDRQLGGSVRVGSSLGHRLHLRNYK